MKLFSPTEVKEANQSQLSRDAARIDLTRQELKKVQSELDISRASFDVVLADQHVRWAREEQEATDRIKVLQDEVKALEKERADALVPIDIDRKKAENMVIEAQSLMAHVNEKREHVDSLTSLLEQKLDDISDREEKTKEKEQALQAREKVLSKQAEVAQAIAQDLNYKMEEFLQNAERRDKELIERKKNLDLLQYQLDNEKEDINERRKSLIKERIRIRDIEKMLERDTKRINKK